ncbi:MAG: methytransferase partner Trm112 [Thermoplasmatota archaeon]
MKKEIVDILCCPVCKADLKLHIEKEDEKEVIVGTLTCTSCHVRYLIEDGIPNLLPQENNKHRD